MVIRSFESDKISCINDFKLFSNGNLIVLFVCSDDTPNFLSMFFYVFLAFSPVWRPLRYVHAIILPLKPFLSILNQPSSMGYYIDKVGNAVS